MTIAELIERLEDLREQVGDDCEVRLATQPNYPLEYAIGEPALAEYLFGGRDGDRIPPERRRRSIGVEMTRCIETGARLTIEEYGTTYVCDLYSVGESIVARVNPEPIPENYAPTHRVTLGRDHFWRADIGVLVAPAYQFDEA
jgi:hypothetical protein